MSVSASPDQLEARLAELERRMNSVEAVVTPPDGRCRRRRPSCGRRRPSCGRRRRPSRRGRRSCGRGRRSSRRGGGAERIRSDPSGRRHRIGSATAPGCRPRDLLRTPAPGRRVSAGESPSRSATSSAGGCSPGSAAWRRCSASSCFSRWPWHVDGLGLRHGPALAGLASLALLGLGTWLHAKRGRTEASIVLVGVATCGLFVTLLVAAHVYALIPPQLAVVGALLTGAAATILAIRWAGIAIALLGLIGALLSPVFVGAPIDALTLTLLAVAAACATWTAVWQRWEWLAYGALAICIPQWGQFVLGDHPLGLTPRRRCRVRCDRDGGRARDAVRLPQ